MPAPPSHDGPIAGVSYGPDFLGWLLLADELRPEAREAVAELKALGLERQLLIYRGSCFGSTTCRNADQSLKVHAEALPAKKMQFVSDEIKRGYRPMVVGDGINDALALKVGAVGIAMGARRRRMTLASADLVLMTNDL